jgi:hypothetical protein
MITKTTYFRLKTAMRKSLWFAAVMLLGLPSLSVAQTPGNENFDGVTGAYPTTTLPRGWSQGKYGVSSNPINQWDLLNGASSANPIVTPPSASNCIRFQSFAIPATEASFIASKRLDMRAIPAGGAALSFKLYRNDQYPANTDNIQVFINDSASVTPGSASQLLLTETGSGLTAINRSITLAPTVAANGWYTYNYIIPNTYNTANVYVCIVGTSAFGDNMYIDDFSVTTYPNAQNYVASSANIFSQNASTTQAGAVNQEIIGIKVTMDGLATPRTMTEFIINTNGTTNPNTDLLNAKLYWTGGTPQFSLQNASLLGTSSNPNLTNDTFLIAAIPGCAPCLTGSASFNALDHGDNYFWVAYDLKPGATSGNFVDAEFVSVRITPNATPITGVTSSLPGNRLIDVVYCQPSYSVGTSWAGYQTNDYIHGVTLVGNNSPVGGINMTNSVNTIYAAAGPLCGGTAYPRRCPFQNHPPDYELFQYPGPALSNSTGPLPVLNATTTGLLCDGNTNYPVSLQVGTYGSANAIAAWIDFNGDGTFNNYFDNLDKLCTGAAGTNTLTLTNISYQNGQHYNYGLETGMTVYGTGIAAGATVTAITATTVTLSVANTGAVSGVITFKNEAPGKDRGEKVAQSGPLQSLQTLSTSFRVPTWAGSFAGKRRFRVREVWINYNIHPCNPATYGETEDYNVTTIPDCAQYPGYKTWLGLTDEWENPVNWCPQGAPIQGSTQNTPCNLRFPGGPPSGSTYAYSKAKIKTGVQARACKMWIAAGDTVIVDAQNASDLIITDSLIIQTATSALLLNTKKNDTIQLSNGTLRITNDQFLRPTQKNRSKWMYTYEEMYNLGLRAGDTIRTIRINLNARNSNGNPYKNFKIKYYFAASNSNLSTAPDPAVVSSFAGFTYPAAPITVFSGDVSVSAIPTGQPGVMAFTLSPGIVIPPGWSGSLCTGLVPTASCALKMVIDMSYDHSGALPLTGDPYNSTSTTEDTRSTQTGNTVHFHTFSTSSAGIVASAETMLAANPINTITQAGSTWLAGSTTINVGVVAAGLSVGMLATSPAALAGRYITNIAGTTITLNTAPAAGGTNLSAIFAHRNPLSASLYRPNLTFEFKRPYIKYPITFSGPSWTNNGTFKADSSIVTFNGAAGQKIEGTSNTNFYDLTVSSPGHVLLNADISTADTLRFTSGRLKLNGRMLRHFNPTIGSIITTATARIQPERDAIGTEVAPFSRFRWNMGTITGPRVLPFSNPAGANVDLTYDKITASGDTAVTFITYSTLATNANYPLPTVTNVNSAFWSGGTGVVDRFWSIQPTDSVNARANLTFRYATSEQLTTATSPINMQRWLNQPQRGVGCVSAGSSVTIVSLGTTDFTLMGAPSNTVGTTFTATGPGTGTGIVVSSSGAGGWEASTSPCGGTFPIVGQVYTTGAPNAVQLNNYSGFNTSPWWTAVGQPQPLPVELLSFTATPFNNKVRLDWTTASEVNADYYNVVRTLDSQSSDFTDIGRMPSRGPSSVTQTYTLWDNNPVLGTQYYFLDQYDLDGSLERFGPVSANFKSGAFEIVTATVSSTESGISVVFSYDSEEPVVYRIMDMAGREVVNGKFTATTGLNALEIDAYLAKGAYQILLQNSSKSVSRKFFY